VCLGFCVFFFMFLSVPVGVRVRVRVRMRVHVRVRVRVHVRVFFFQMCGGFESSQLKLVVLFCQVSGQETYELEI